MEILYRGFYQIDYEQSKAIPRIISESFDGHIKRLINFVVGNEAIQLYKTRSETTEVVVILKQWLNDYTASLGNDGGEFKSDKYFNGIAQRLLTIETNKQEQIKNLKHEITKWNLLMSLIKDGDNYIILISKVNNSFFIDDKDLNEKTGFSSKDQHIWKTTIFECTMEEENDVDIESIKVYLKNKADYWWNEFLEVDKMQCDEINTSIAHTNIEKVLTTMVKRKSPSDYFCLSNAVIGYIKKGGHFDYSIMINDIFKEYKGDNLSEEDLSKVITKLEKLPEEKKFDRQFTAIPSEVKSKVKRFYTVTQGIELKINGPIDDKLIKATEDNSGNKYIQIKTTDLETFNTFKKNELIQNGEGEVGDK